jgi:hypothetical protein
MFPKAMWRPQGIERVYRHFYTVPPEPQNPSPAPGTHVSRAGAVAWLDSLSWELLFS